MDQLNNNDDIGSIAETLKYSSGDIDLIEMNTRGQSNNNLWFAMRKGKFDLDILSIYPTPEKFLRRPVKQQWVDYLQIKLVNSKSQTTIFPMLLDPEIGASNTVCERLGGLVNDAEEGTKECNSKMKLTVVNKYPRLCLFPSVILRKGKKFVMFMERSRRSCHGIGNFSSPQASVPVGKEVGAIASTVVVEPVLTKASVPVVKEVGAIASTVAVEPVEAKTKASTVVVVAEHTIKLLNGDEDGAKVRAAERARGRNAELCPDAVYRIYVKEKKTLGQKRKKKDAAEVEESSILQTKYPKNELPQAPYVLTAEE
ncbi:unnamed protein product [Mytilus edulis]|uniref:Uncharacterized protein n=1 Tax=Mytilus edulis TaxID=6550 RepID=A0A8S3SMH6_MYTED|nr:unnamed protein product [Mytilus edulis]